VLASHLASGSPADVRFLQPGGRSTSIRTPAGPPPALRRTRTVRIAHVGGFPDAKRAAASVEAPRWARARHRRRRALFVSSPIGLGHARRDIAIATELRRHHPDLAIDWLAQHPVTRMLEDAGEHVHPASGRLASESAHIESESGEHRPRLPAARLCLRDHRRGVPGDAAGRTGARGRRTRPPAPRTCPGSVSTGETSKASYLQSRPGTAGGCQRSRAFSRSRVGLKPWPVPVPGSCGGAYRTDVHPRLPADDREVPLASLTAAMLTQALPRPGLPCRPKGSSGRGPRYA